MAHQLHNLLVAAEGGRARVDLGFIMDGYVLLVEDNEDIREMMSLALQLAGARVVCASNGLEALSILKDRRPPDIILLDLMMPVMNGWEFSAELKRDERLQGIPVVVISAMGEPGAASLRPAEFIAKPVDIDRLIDVVAEHTSRAGKD